MKPKNVDPVADCLRVLNSATNRRKRAAVGKAFRLAHQKDRDAKNPERAFHQLKLKIGRIFRQEVRRIVKVRWIDVTCRFDNAVSCGHNEIYGDRHEVEIELSADASVYENGCTHRVSVRYVVYSIDDVKRHGANFGRILVACVQ